MKTTQNNSVTEQLEAIGLSNHEAALYVEILRNGEASVGILLENVKLHREQAYRALKRLEESGLVRQYEKRKRAYFAVTNPDLLVKQVEEKVEIAKALQPVLKGMHIRQPHVVQVREGAESFDVLFGDILQTIQKNGEYLILGGQGEAFEQLTEVWPVYEKGVKVFAKKNIKLRMLAFEGQDFSDQFATQPLLEVRELPGAYISPVATVIYGNKVALEVMDPDNTSIVTIENKSIAESYRQQFEALWKIAKPVSRP
jgi:sugar-specific transcriptional regulator TrmB